VPEVWELKFYRNAYQMTDINTHRIKTSPGNEALDIKKTNKKKVKRYCGRDKSKVNRP